MVDLTINDIVSKIVLFLEKISKVVYSLSCITESIICQCELCTRKCTIPVEGNTARAFHTLTYIT